MDRKTLHEVLSMIPYGISIITSRESEKHVTMLATWLTQVSFHPPLIALAVESDSHMLRAINAAGYFAVNFLPGGGKKIASAFLKPAEVRDGKIAGQTFTAAAHGSCFLDAAAACMECQLVGAQATGDHTLVVGEVVHVEAHGAGAPLLLSATGWKYQR